MVDADEEATAPPTKKPKVDLPEYGSKEYWEQRYATQDQAQHSWYFTYDELRPILLSILMGRSPTSDESASDEDDEGDDDNSLDNNEQINDAGDENSRSDVSQSSSVDLVSAVNDIGSVADNTTENNAGIATHNGSCSTALDDEEEEIEEIIDLGTNAIDKIPLGLGLAGPIKILEIGCGDVPLGEHLAKDVEFEEILCTDYSETVIQKLLQQNIPSLLFRTMDARKMDLADQSYQLVLDKGTLDAMLSDTKHGVEHCVSIVAECARVLTTPGCMVLVSHLNAHTVNGIHWLHEVVFPGLRSISSKNVQFLVEVHGNDVAKDESSSSEPNESAGPAVYVIHKYATEEEDCETKDDDGELVFTIPIQFFTYC